jgi:hypothetical protein
MYGAGSQTPEKEDISIEVIGEAATVDTGTSRFAFGEAD